MSKKTVGYVELEWVCPNCGNKNVGMIKTCGSCGSPQPQNIQFEVGQNRELITDSQKTAAAARGADIHCPYCNTRNIANAEVCIHCGGDLKEGVRRESGRVLSGAPVNSGIAQTCPNCGTSNPGTNNTCSACGTSLAKSLPQSPVTPSLAVSKQSAFRPWMMLPIAAILMICCVVFAFFFFRTTAQTGVVQNSHWQRGIGIEEQRPVTREAWKDQLPGGTEVLSCQQEYRSREENPVAGAKEVCSTELIDKGNGAAEVVETCFYEVYDDYCKYQVLEWQNVDQVTAQGTDLQPYWPQVDLNNGRREGDRSETYTVIFETEDGIKQFTTSNAALFVQLQPGTQWTLTLNALGAIVDVSP